MHSETFDIVIIGGGVIGLGAAWAARRRGARVCVLEANRRAEGASVRNFGMIWPIGQPLGERRELALRTRTLWLDAAETFDVDVNTCGSLHAAHHDDEWSVLQEFAAAASDADLSLLTPDEVHDVSPAVAPAGLRGGLFSPWECGVEPRIAIHALTDGLQHAGVQVAFDARVVTVNENEVTCADGRRFLGERILCCSGAEFASLFPNTHREAGLRRCKLQMMRTLAQPDGFRLGPHLASGLSLRHYAAFRECPSVPSLRARIERTCPDLDRYGIHVMASQGSGGSIILGDSHEYEADVSPFDRALIEELMLRELKRVYRFPAWSIAERWHGIYAAHPREPYVACEAIPGVTILNGFGGHGMSIGLGAAERVVSAWFGEAVETDATQGEGANRG